MIFKIPLFLVEIAVLAQRERMLIEGENKMFDNSHMMDNFSQNFRNAMKMRDTDHRGRLPDHLEWMDDDT